MPSRRLTIEILGEARKLNTTLGQVDTRLGKFERSTGRVSKGVAALFASGVIVLGLRTGGGAAQEAAAVGRQTEAVIKSTGSAAGLSSKGFADLATQISKNAAVDDDLVQAGENILATFTNIKASGPDKIFQRAEQAAVDMAAAMGHGEVTAQGLQTANIQLGKALNDPIKGMTALQKIGVTFSAQQKEQIKGFVETGQLAKAQGVILAEVNKEFGGSAAAAATGAKRFQVAVGNLEESLGGALLPTMERGANIAAGLAEGFTSLDKSTGGLASKGLLAAVGLGGIAFAAGKTLKFVKESKEAWLALRAAKLANVVVAPAVITTEGGLTVATTASGTAASRAAIAWGTLRGVLVSFVGPALVVVGAFAALKQEHDKYAKTQRDANKLSAEQARLAKQQIGPNQILHFTVAEATKAWEDYNAKQSAALPGLAAAGDAATDGADHFTRMAGAVKTAAGEVPALSKAAQDLATALSTELRTGRDSILGVADAFEHGKRASKVSARAIIGDLRNEVDTLKTWAKDAQELLKRGMSPDAVANLSERGPEYLHAFATGSDRQVATFEKLFKQRMASATDAAQRTGDSSSLAFRDLRADANKETAKIKAAKARVDGAAAAAREMRRFRDQSNAAINGIHGTNVNVIAHAKIDRRELRSGLAAIASGNPRAMATGGKVPGTGNADNQLIYATPGEAVVPKRLVPAIAPWLREHGVPGFATGGVVPRTIGRVGSLRPDMQGEVNRVSAALAVGTLRAATKGVAKFLRALEALGGVTGAGSAAIKRFIRSTDSHPYVWGGAGPGGYDCSGLTGAVYGKMRGRGGGSGQRYFTTASNFGRLGFKPGVGGTYAIGVLPGVHMAGNYGGLRFEARSTASGIKTGGAARSVGSFPVRYHMASGGLVRSVNRLAGIPGIDIGGDEAGLRFAAGRLPVFDSGGRLRPGVNVVENRTGRDEDLVPAGRGQPIVVQVNLDGRRVAEQVTYWQRKAAR